MTPQEIHDLVKQKFDGAVVEAKLDAPQPWIKIAPEKIVPIGLLLRDEPSCKFDYLMCLSGVDYTKGALGVVYHLSSMEYKHKIVLKVSCTVENPHVPSVSSIWGTAEWHEREAYDMMGIIFDEHPDLRRILCPDDWVGHPLRKDYKVPEFYNGMKVAY